MKNWKALAFHENQKLAGARLEQIQHVEGHCWILFQSFYFLVSETEAWRETQKQPRSVFYACTVMSDSLQPHGLQPARLLCPWDFPARILEREVLSPPPEDLPYPRIKQSLEAPALAVRLFTTEPLKCPSIDQWMKMWYNRILLSHNRGEMGLFVEMQMDLEFVIEWNKSEREKQVLSIKAYMWTLWKQYWWT